ncbi:hypothetical protein POJ06DRAFT_112595 [Lipomyces tetrasporus]|uniref:N-acetyltransferase domain-containing protein n=1 Tax=Lipomyces tetrasporus TaxID=54092 RepID=A0AAD7VS26_9ASCO|nr:uncharacterized protein POJ06DRAFT_112595 [Lipomyces tetrasporus]KAJ8099551.1 hypothetical protein POJ06DRAFT_112595 [Lipomyces tetrasporus]
MEKRSEIAKVVLIPWNPNSSEHRQRLYEQRVACGWRSDMIEKWRTLQIDGKMAIQWVVLSDDDPDRDNKLARHIIQFQSEKESILDSASLFGGKPRALPDTPRSFIPVGHISLDSENADRSLADRSQGLYCISTFYISRALQGNGLGRAAMDAVENMAANEPLCAKALALETIAREFTRDEKPWKAFGIPYPVVCRRLFSLESAFTDCCSKVTNQDWYERRGYDVYKRVEQIYEHPDLSGKTWVVPTVFMQKSVTQSDS